MDGFPGLLLLGLVIWWTLHVIPFLLWLWYIVMRYLIKLPGTPLAPGQWLAYTAIKDYLGRRIEEFR